MTKQDVIKMLLDLDMKEAADNLEKIQPWNYRNGTEENIVNCSTWLCVMVYWKETEQGNDYWENICITLMRRERFEEALLKANS